MKENPLVSVIIPNLNDGQRLKKCLDGLMSQTLGRVKFEVIVVDNGSSDGSIDVINAYPVQLLQVTNVSSPYVCRNKGIQAAKGAIIVLLDGKCVPDPAFLSAGMTAMQKESLEVVIGNSIFEFGTPPSPAEWVDRILFAQGEEMVFYKKNFPTRALFIKRALFDRFGLFLSVRSGADSEWSSRVFAAGTAVGYAPAAKVYFPATKYRALMKKARRFGRGAKAIYLQKNGSIPLSWRFRQGLYFLPPNPIRLYRRVKRFHYPIPAGQLILVWWVLWQFKITRGWEGVFLK